MAAAISKQSINRKMSAANIQRFKHLGKRIDAQEQEEIKARGRAVFQRHGVARQMVEKLKAKRLQAGVSITEMATRTGIAKSNLSRLENSNVASPTLETLHRYAQALGLQVRVELNG